MGDSIAAIAQIGQYEVGPELGKGAFATVRSATHLPTGEKACSPVDSA